MVGLLYVGSNPNNVSVLSLKVDADTAATNAVVTTDYVNTTIAGAVGPLRNKAYVDQQDALRAKKTDVVAADAKYLARNLLGQAGGICGLNSSGQVPSANLPSGIPNDRVFTAYCLSSNALGGSQSGTGVTGINYLSGNLSHTCTTAGSVRDFLIAKMTIADPGFPWLPFPFAWVRGYAGGSGSYGLLTCMPTSGGSTTYGVGLGTDSPNYYGRIALMPYAAPGAIPTKVNGALELGLYANLWSGTSGYVFTGSQLQYMVLAVPAL